MEGRPQHHETIFDAVAKHDLEEIINEYVKNSRSTVISYLSLRKRWSSLNNNKSELYREEGKLDEYLQQITDEASTWTSSAPNSSTGTRTSCEEPYNSVLQEISSLFSVQEQDNHDTRISSKDSTRLLESSMDTSISEEGDRLIWQSINVLSNSRPSSSFVVFDRDGGAVTTITTDAQQQQQPLFDGSVANATPPPLGVGPPGVRPSAGSGTLLHLACAVDSPFALAVFLALGADARSPHTAFRRLMIHEAACCGSIQCLTLLLELGKECALQLYKEVDLNLPSPHYEESSSVFVKDACTNDQVLPFFPSSDALESQKGVNLPLSKISRQPKPSFGLPKKPAVPETKNYLQKLKHFSDLATRVRLGEVTELDAARTVLAYDTISTASRQIIAQSCSFLVKNSTISGNPFNCPWYADGHGNTPLHWAAFKNERECVSILLKYHVDPNTRAHPSGWTALHDAAYSNSRESVELLLNAGADVDIRANSGATPLCFAAQEDAHEASRLLLGRGADLSARCAGGPRGGNNLFQQAAHATTATEAAVVGNNDNNNNDANNALQQAGVAVPVPHPNGRFSGYTPLHYCAHYNAYRAARVLLAHVTAGDAMEIRDLSDRLPIHVAVARGSSDVLRELLHAGARIDTPNGPPSSPKRRRESSRPGSRSSTPLRSRAVVAIQELPTTPTHSLSRSNSEDSVSTPVSSPVLRSMIPARPITSSKPWNCLSQRSIDECRRLITEAEKHWAPDRHLLFTPSDRRAVMELLRVGKRLEQAGTGIFIDLWPLVLSFCGRGWFEYDTLTDDDEDMSDVDQDEMHLSSFSQEMEGVSEIED